MKNQSSAYETSDEEFPIQSRKKVKLLEKIKKSLC